MTPAQTTTREVHIESLVIDVRFASLFLEEPTTISRIARSIRANGFDQHRPIDVWKDGAGRGRHVVIEGHQRLAAAKRAGLDQIKVAYRHFDGFPDAFVWSAEQQTNRRNASKEAQALSILRALKLADEPVGTTADLADRFGFSTATLDRAKQVLARGTESEIAAVLEGKHGLKTAYELIKRRERDEAAPVTDEPPAPPEAAEQPEPDEEPVGPDAPELEAVRGALDDVSNALDDAHDLFGREQRIVLGTAEELRKGAMEDLARRTDDALDAWAKFEAAVAKGEGS